MLKSDNRLYEFGPFRLDPARRLLFRDEEPLPLRSKTFDTLLALVRSNGRIIGKDELMKEVWADTIVEESGLTRNISEVRKTLGESPGERRYIVTVPGCGYRFVAAVREVEDTSDKVEEGTHTASGDVTGKVIVGGAIAGLNQPPFDPIIPDADADPRIIASRFEITTMRRKRGLALGLASLTVVVSLAVGMYRAMSHSKDRGPEPKIINSTAFIGSELAPSFSPDGSQIAFVRFGAHGIISQVYVIRADGSAPHAVTPPALEGSAPHWSPTGRLITFTSNCCRPGSNIYVMHPAGTGIRRLTHTPFPHNSFQSAYAPQADRIAFASDRRYPDSCCNDLFVMRSNGTQETLVHTGLTGVLSPSWGTAPLAKAGSGAPAIPNPASSSTGSRRADGRWCRALPQVLRTQAKCARIHR